MEDEIERWRELRTILKIDEGRRGRGNCYNFFPVFASLVIGFLVIKTTSLCDKGFVAHSAFMRLLIPFRCTEHLYTTNPFHDAFFCLFFIN